MIYISGGNSGIGEAVARLLSAAGKKVTAFGREGCHSSGYDMAHIEGIVCCAGSHDNPVDDCLGTTIQMFELAAQSSTSPVCIALSGGGIGGPPSIDLPGRYIAAKAAICSYVEWFSLVHNIQAFVVAPGPTATRLTNFTGAHPDVPARFIVELLSGKYAHLSGSLLAAQRDDLRTALPMKLRREPDAGEGGAWRGDPTP